MKRPATWLKEWVEADREMLETTKREPEDLRPEQDPWRDEGGEGG